MADDNRVEPPTNPGQWLNQQLDDLGLRACTKAEQVLLKVAAEYDEDWLRASISGAKCFPNHPEAQRDARLYEAMLVVKGLKP